MEKIKPNPENPEHFTGIKLTKPKKVAAGIPAVLSSIKHVFGEMGIVRGNKALLALNQKGGFDCPGCAWPDPDDDRSPIAEYCENGAKAIAEEATVKSLTPEFFAKNSVEALSRLTDYEIGKKGRVAHPMYLKADGTHYEAISWDMAFEKIAKHLNKLNSPDEAVFYTSGRTSNEAAFLYQLFIRAYGTNNLPDCSNMCHESSGVALSQSLGIGKGSVKLEDFYEAEVIIVLGQNPGTNHPRMLSALKKAKENNCKIISVNPLKETGLIGFKNPQEVNGVIGSGTQLTDLFLQVKLNGDMALLQAINHALIQADNENPNTILDHEFMKNHTFGSEEYLKHIQALNYNELISHTGLQEHEVQQAIDIIKPAKKIIACWAMGLTQHKNAVNTIQEVVNLLLIKGSIGKKGAGTCPVRGHSNVQGDRTMGIYEKPPQAFLDNIERVFGFKPPQHHGYDVVDAIHAMKQGKAKVFIAMGGNFLSATPDTTYTAEALNNTDLTVQVSTKLNRSHLITGKEAIILPTLGRADKDILNGEKQFISVENSMGVVSSSKGNLTPISDHLLSEPAIVCHLAKAVLGNKYDINWDKYLQHYDHIRDDIEKTIPGFDGYNLRVRQPSGFYLPNGARYQEFKTHTGKANFNIANIEPIALKPKELIMMTIRTHDQFNTTIYGLHDRYRGIYNERRVILIHAEDIKLLGFKPNDIVDIYNEYGGVSRVAHRFILIEYDIPRQCIATYFPETNVLVPIDSTADKSNTPTSKTVIVTLKKSE